MIQTIKSPEAEGDQDLLLCLAKDQGLFIFESISQNLISQYQVHKETIRQIGCLNSLGLVLSGTDQGTVRLHDLSHPEDLLLGQ